MLAKRLNTVFNRRVRSKEAADAARNTEALYGARKFIGFHAAQALQRIDHRRGVVHEICCASVSMVFTPAAEVSNDHRGEEAQADIENKRRHIVADARTFIFITQNLAVNHPTDDAGDEEHESVHHALQKRHRHHIAILHMAHFMSKNGFNFLSIHRAQESRRHCDERIGARGARGESVGFAFIDGDFRHRKTRFIGELAHGFNDVLLHAVAGIIHVNHREAHRHLRHHLGGEE